AERASPPSPSVSAMTSVYHSIMLRDGTTSACQTCRARGGGGRPGLFEDPLSPAPTHPDHLRLHRRLRRDLHADRLPDRASRSRNRNPHPLRFVPLHHLPTPHRILGRQPPHRPRQAARV